MKLAAATYLKNFTRRNTDATCTNSSTSKEFRDQLMRALLQVEPPVLKVLIEAVCTLTSNLSDFTSFFSHRR